MKVKILLIVLLHFALQSVGQIDTFGKFESIEEGLKTPNAVKSLNLSNQDLKLLPNEIILFENLRKIDLGENPNLDLQQTFTILKELPCLESLLLQESKLHYLPDNIDQLKNLQELGLDDNEFTELPPALMKMKRLKYLRLFNNQITQLQLDDSDLPSLEFINLCYNTFETFPIALTKLPRLKRIQMWACSVREIPSAVEDFNVLEELDLGYNHLSRLPIQLGKVKSLKKLILKNNDLTDTAIEVLAQLPGLTNLGLSDNPIQSIPSEFRYLQKLEQLGIGSLKIQNWTKVFSILSQLVHLERVGMSAMKLDKMPAGFEQLQQVKIFWLTANRFDQKEKMRIAALVPKAEIIFR